MSNKQVAFPKIFIVIFLLSASVQSLAKVVPSKSTDGENREYFYSSIAQKPLTVSPSASTNTSITDNRQTIINNQQENLIATVVSVLSFIVSLTVAYVSTLRRANIKLSLGRNIILFCTPINVSSGSGVILGVGFNLPITFYNWSPKGGTIKKMRMVIGRQNTDDSYDMIWTTFVKIGSSGNFEDENLAQPIPIKGQSSVNKIIRFDWSPDLGGQKFDVQTSNYELRIYAWVRDTEKPDLEYKASFAFKDEHYQKFNNSVAANLSLSIWLSLDENEKPNQLVSKNTIDRLYSKGK